MTRAFFIALMFASLLAVPASVCADPSAEPPVDDVSAERMEKYVWLQDRDDLGDALTSLDQAFAPPPGFTRVEVAPSSFQAYLRGLPMRTDRTERVRRFDGELVTMPSAGIVPLDIGDRDIHQCADSVIRLRAEFLWSEGRANEVAFHFTSGDLARWSDWRAGKVLRSRDHKIKQVKTKKWAGTHRAFRRYLRDVFVYASTRSLHKDATKIKTSTPLEAGDFFLQSGSPGHVVILLDVAAHPDGRRVALVGQGFLPAVEFHVITGAPKHALNGVWFTLPEGTEQVLKTPTWAAFSRADAWRF